MAGETVDLDAVSQACRVRLLLARSATGALTLAERLAGGLHEGSPPDNADYPYGALRVLNLRRRAVDGPFWSADLEVELFYRPRAAIRELRQAVDVAVEALVGWSDAAALAAGISAADVRDSDVLPPFSESADPEVVRSRTVFVLDLFPTATP